MWVGSGRRVDEEGDLSPSDAAAAAAAAGVGADDFAYLWEYAIAADWLSDDEDADEDRVLPGETAEAWTDDTDEDVCFAWFVTLGAVLDETLEVAEALGAGAADGWRPSDEPAADDEDDDGRRGRRGRGRRAGRRRRRGAGPRLPRAAAGARHPALHVPRARACRARS